ncbi:winged helix-turn-helix domain-containing protein [Candidatus Woesearchaeota archaeon]|nr:winged helix-turn-helix domain-containing protein [Candidatus Woesearchaeota archaeon]
MADKNKILMIDLNEDGLEKISEVLANKTCRKILNLLADNELTQSQLAKELGISLSLAQYNLDKLVESNLVVSEKFHYSKKGREIKHYSLANKHIIISPKKVTGVKTKLKSILPITVIGLGIASIITAYKLFTTKIGSHSASLPREFAKASADTALEEGALEVAPIIAESARNVSTYQSYYIEITFIFIVIIITLLFFVREYFKRRKKK